MNGRDRAASAGRALRPRPVLRLALPVLRLRRLRGRGGPRPAGAGRRVRPARSRPRSTCAPTRSTPTYRRRPAGAREPLPRRRDAVAARRRRSSRGSSTRVRARFGLADDAEVTLEANPGPDERGDPAAWVDAGVTRLSFGAQSMDDRQLKRLGRRHRRGGRRRRGRARRARPGSRSVSLDLLYDVPDQSVAELDDDPRRRPRPRAGPPLALRARRSTTPTPRG